MRKRRKGSHLNRYRQIAQVLARHSLGYLVSIFGLKSFVPFHRSRSQPLAPYTRPEHLRMALEELGATFIKLGQILSTRVDLLPDAYQAEFAKLQDQAPQVSAELIQKLLVAELGLPLEEVFATFETTPLAAASIGQVHAATLLDGTKVVVKVRRPGVVDQIEQDLEIIENLAVAASHRWKLAEQYDLVGLAQEFAQTLRAELDYIREGHNAERIAANFSRDPTLHVPRVFWQTTTTQILTLERIEGIKINNFAALEAAGIDRALLAEQATKVILKMIFEDGFYHADLHPGNFFIEPDGRIGLIDFGMVGTVDERTRTQLVRLFLAITGQDADQLVDTFLELGISRQRVNRELLRRDLEHLLGHYYSLPLAEIEVGQLLEDSLEIIRRHNLQLPSKLALLLKTATMSEGLGSQLSPAFRLTEVMVPFAKQLMLQEYSPARWAKKLGRAGLEATSLGVELPHQLRRMAGHPNALRPSSSLSSAILTLNSAHFWRVSRPTKLSADASLFTNSTSSVRPIPINTCIKWLAKARVVPSHSSWLVIESGRPKKLTKACRSLVRDRLGRESNILSSCCRNNMRSPF